MSEQIYLYEFFGDFWANNRNYQIEIIMPTKYTTPKDAKADSSSARFEKHDGHVVLVIYSDWEQGMENGKWFEHVAGSVLDVIHWEDWNKYKMSQAKGEGIEGMGNDPITDYVPCSTKWDELFDVSSLSDNWGYSVESLAYTVLAYINCEN